MSNAATRLYQYLFIFHPLTGIALIATLLIACSYFIGQVEIEVSGDSLVLEQDADLEYYREISTIYGSDEYLVITFQPHGGLFASESLATLGKLGDDLRTVSHVNEVITLLDVPLLFSPPMSLTELSREQRLLLDAGTNLELAKQELSTEALYSDRLVSRDLSTTAIQVTFETDQELIELREQREALRKQRTTGKLDDTASAQLARIESRYDERLSQDTDMQSAAIQQIRTILEAYRSEADIHMGGIPMIVTDMLSYIRKDLMIYGIAVLCVMAIMIWFAFNEIRWILLPLTCVGAAAVATTGIIGMLGWPISAVSSNYLALLLIFGLSLMIHLVVQYDELNVPESTDDRKQRIIDVLKRKFAPSFYTILTTIIAFASLVVSNIRPVIDFGWIMVVALIVNLLVAFTLFPALLSLSSPRTKPVPEDLTRRVTRQLAEWSLKFPFALAILFIVLTAAGSYGITLLSVDNRFIDYFAEDTAIYKGMTVIDEKLGGTTPLDLIINAPESSRSAKADSMNQDDPFSEAAFDEPSLDASPFDGSPFDESPFDAPDTKTQGSFTDSSYWFNTTELDRVAGIHNYLDALEDTGKVLSLHSLATTLQKLNDNRAPDDFFLSLFYQNASDKLKSQLIDPYLSEDGQQLRFSMRVYESDSGLDRQGLINHISETLQESFELDEQQFRLTGMVVLYNNLLQSLFDSQIKTLGVVFLAIGLIFIVVFQNVKVALLALIPNIVSGCCVLGLFGLLSVPLDLMTITVAAISVGIAVDDTIHYTHRFREELKRTQDYDLAIRNAHRSIGKAMYYTSITIACGFAVMMFSNFTPTLYFGVFTAFSMLIAMFADMTLLPILLKTFRAYQKRA